MSIVTGKQLDLLREVGAVVRQALEAMRAALVPGIKTRDLDDMAAAVLARNRARAAPRRVYNFPGHSCISVNEEIVHGVPRDRIIQQGDLVTMDVTAEKDGFVADAAITVAVPPATPLKAKLVECVETAFERAMAVARSGRCVSDIGRAVEDEVKAHGFSVVRELTGHGIGRVIHEKPTVANYYDPRFRHPLTEGLVIAVEPIIAARSPRTIGSPDGWTVLTADGSLAAHFEQTIAITAGRPIILTEA